MADLSAKPIIIRDADKALDFVFPGTIYYLAIVKKRPDPFNQYFLESNLLNYQIKVAISKKIVNCKGLTPSSH